MRVLVCPFAIRAEGGARVAERVVAGWLQRSPGDVLRVQALAAAGVDALAALHGPYDPLGPRTLVPGPAARLAPAPSGPTAWVVVPEVLREPATARGGTSRAVGAELREAASGGSERIVVVAGRGGPGRDGGAGMLAALGAKGWTDEEVDLASIRLLDLRLPQQLFDSIDLVLATDWEGPLCGARGVATFEPSPPDPDALERELRHWGKLLGRRPDGRRPAVALGSGAGGGLGAALLALGARRVPATPLVLEGLGPTLDRTDLMVIVTSELDPESLFEPPLAHAVGLATERALPVVILANTLGISRREWIRHGISAAFDVRTLTGARPDSARPPGSDADRDPPPGI